MAGPGRFDSRERCHVVMIPGFGGFDALGNIEYYAGVTGVFQTWRAASHRPVVLHYFDNLPTAGVVTRAARLRSYLAKRIARREILEDDEIILVGHSTGGLDIRQLIWDLHSDQNGDIRVDGGTAVALEAIRSRIHRVVFLSVPHWGTNIADWVRSHPWLRSTVIAELRAGVSGSQLRAVDRLEDLITGGAACLTDTDLLRAVRDAITEASERYGARGPQRTAEAYEAAALLGLYLRDIAADFHAIDDLASRRPKSGPRSPAHFDRQERERELALWRDPHISVLSYATVADSPFSFAAGGPAPVWELTDPCSWPEIAKDRGRSAGTDLSYRVCYRACAGGPFGRPEGGGRVTRRLDGAPQRRLELWDNDGIVNTLSMLWPKTENVLVAGDHLDIVGHFRLVEVDDVERDYCPSRRYRSYDLLRSTPGSAPKRSRRSGPRSSSSPRAARIVRPRAIR